MVDLEALRVRYGSPSDKRCQRCEGPLSNTGYCWGCGAWGEPGDPAVLALVDAYEVAATKAMRFDLDQAGIEYRERDAAELVELRAKVADASRRLAALSAAFAAVSDGRGHAAVKLVATDLDICGFCGGTRAKHAPGCRLGPFVPHNEGGE